MHVYRARFEFRFHDLLNVNKTVPSMIRSTECRMEELHVRQRREQAHGMRYDCRFQRKNERMKKILSELRMPGNATETMYKYHPNTNSEF